MNEIKQPFCNSLGCLLKERKKIRFVVYKRKETNNMTGISKKDLDIYNVTRTNCFINIGKGIRSLYKIFWSVLES